MACTVFAVKASNGKDSILFQELLNRYDQEQAVRFYLASQGMDELKSASTVDTNGELLSDYVSELLDGNHPNYSIANEAESRSEKLKFKPAVDMMRRTIAKLDQDYTRESNLAVRDYAKLAQITMEKAEKERELRKLQSPDSPIKSIHDLNSFANKEVSAIKDLVDNGKLVHPSDLTHAFKVVDTWKNAVRTMAKLDEIEQAGGEFEFHIKDIDALEKRLNGMNKAMALTLASKGLGYAITQEQAFLMAKDMSGLGSNVLDISRVDNPLFQAAHKIVTDNNIRIHEEVTQLKQELGAAMKKAKQQMASGWLKMFQQTQSGLLTGNLIDRYTPEWYKEGGTLRGQALDTGLREDWHKYYTWCKKNTLIIDPRAVSPELQDHGKPMTEDEIAAHRERIERLSDSKEADRLYAEAKAKVDAYTGIKEGAMASIENEHEEIVAAATEHITDPVQAAGVRDSMLKGLDTKKAVWILENSPYHLSAYVDGRSRSPFHPQFAGRYGVQMATQDQHFDSRFKEMQQNPPMMEAYEKMTDICAQLMRYLPEDVQRNIYRNGLPAVGKTTMEAFKEHPYQLGVIIDALKKSASIQDQQGTSSAMRDSNNQTDQKLRANIVANHKTEIAEIVKRNKIAFQEREGRVPTKPEVTRMREEATDHLVRLGSLNMEDIMSHFIEAAVTYKYKSRIEDHLNIINRAIQDSVFGNTLNKAGEAVTDKDGNPIPQDNLKNAKAQWDYFMRHWYEEGKPVSMKAGEKSNWLMTTREKNLKTELTSLRASVETRQTGTPEELDAKNKQLATIDKQLKGIGSYLAGSKVGDMLMKYMIYKTLAWNPFSAVSNVLQGVYSNLVEGAAGEHYSNGELMKAFSLTMHSLAAFYSGGTVKTETAMKIRNIIDRLGVVEDVTKELYEEGVGDSWMKALKGLMPMNMQQRSEYINQAPMVIAMMMHKKILLDGAEHSLWECFDKNGDWKFGENKEWNGSVNNMDENLERNNFITQVKSVMKQNHGNYDALNSPLMAKENITGRALVMFRTWIFDMAHHRFAGQWTDYQNSAGAVQRKGFYRSFGALSKAEGGPIHALVDTGMQLVRKLAFQSTTYGSKVGQEGFTDMDAANMRRVVTEMMSFLMVSSAYFALKGLLPADDDKAKAFRNMSLNTILRLKTDLTFFSNPMSAESLNKNVVPLFGVFTDFSRIASDIPRWIDGDDKISSGTYAHRSRILRDAEKVMPFGNMIAKFFSEGATLYDKPGQ